MAEAGEPKKYITVEFAVDSGSGSVFAPPLDASKDELVYPITYFQTNSKKVDMEIPKGILRGKGILSSDETHLLVRELIGNKKPIPRQLFVKYAWDACAKNVSCRVNSEWTTYGILISEKDRDVTILDLCHLIEGEEFTYNTETGNAAPVDGDEIDIITSLFVGIRTAHGARQDYQKTVYDRSVSSYKAMKDPNVELLNTRELIQHLKDDSSVLRMMSFIDMLLFHSMRVDKSKTKYGCLRLGTLITRFRDMASITSLSQASNYFGLDQIDFLNWIFDSAIRADVRRLSRFDPYLHRDGSYGPYFGGMQIAAGNPYSSVKNSNFFNFIHFAGALGMNRRSMNARFLGLVNIHASLINAIVFMFAKSRRLKVSEAVVKKTVQVPVGESPEEYMEKVAKDVVNKQEMEAKRAQEQMDLLAMSSDQDPNEAPSTDDIDAWRSYVARTSCPTPEMVVWAVGVIRCFDDVREGTMAAELRKWADSKEKGMAGNNMGGAEENLG